MIRRPPRSTLDRSSAASDVYKRQTPERAAELGVELKSSPREVASASDIVSVHVALTPETKHFLSTDFFNAMNEGAYFINTARGEVVDQQALVEAMRNRGIRAGLDVY